MNHRIVKAATLMLLFALIIAGTSCKLLQEKVVDVVINTYAEMEFEEREDSANFTTPDVVNVAAKVDSALASIDMTREDIVEVRLVGGTYDVTWLEDPEHDWVISGEILLSYDGEESTLVDYDSQSLYDALGAGEITVDLNSSGVSLFNRALEDYISDPFAYPELTFTVTNDACTPTPSPSDSLKFDWTGRVYMYIVVEQEVEIIDL